MQEMVSSVPSEAKATNFKQSSLYNKHISFNADNDIEQIIAPLKKIGINFLSYHANLPNNERVKVSNGSDWMQYFYMNALYKALLFERDQISFIGKIIPWAWLNQEPVYNKAREFAITNGVTIIHKGINCDEFFHFSRRGLTEFSIENYLQIREALFSFIPYFHEKAKFLLAKARVQKLVMPSAPIKKPIANELSLFSLKRFYLDEYMSDTYLTRREVEVSLHLIEGKITKTIAADLSKSTRSIEGHIESLKRKLNCQTLFQLGFKLARIYDELYRFNEMFNRTSVNN